VETATISHLKAHLAEHLRYVQSGQTLVVTDHNRAVARILPMEADALIQRPASRPFTLVLPVGVPTGLSAQSLLNAERGEN
jgi:prevent-host-death family protein